jgi:hypothetical protein
MYCTKYLRSHSGFLVHIGRVAVTYKGGYTMHRKLYGHRPGGNGSRHTGGVAEFVHAFRYPCFLSLSILFQGVRLVL